MGRQTSEAFVPWPLVSEESGGRTGLSAKSTPGDLALHLDSLDTATAKKLVMTHFLGFPAFVFG